LGGEPILEWNRAVSQDNPQLSTEYGFFDQLLLNIISDSWYKTILSPSYKPLKKPYTLSENLKKQIHQI
jgi:hypothetical protein